MNKNNIYQIAIAGMLIGIGFSFLVFALLLPGCAHPSHGEAILSRNPSTKRQLEDDQLKTQRLKSLVKQVTAPR